MYRNSARSLIQYTVLYTTIKKEMCGMYVKICLCICVIIFVLSGCSASTIPKQDTSTPIDCRHASVSPIVIKYKHSPITISNITELDYNTDTDVIYYTRVNSQKQCIRGIVPAGRVDICLGDGHLLYDQDKGWLYNDRTHTLPIANPYLK